jgi:hypothetical protein
MPFLTSGRNLSDSTLIYLSHSPRGFRVILPILLQVPQHVLLQPRIVEPDIIVPTVVREFFFVLNSPFTQDSVLERCSCPMLLFEFGVCSI